MPLSILGLFYCYYLRPNPPASSSSPLDAASAAAHNTSRSNHSYYHYLLDTHIPGLRNASPQRSRINRVTI